MTLQSLGWAPHFARALAELELSHTSPARVAREDRDRYLLLTGEGEASGVLAGRLRHAVQRREDLPAVGDWVACERSPGGDARIVAVLPRRSAFVRKAAGETTAAQVIAANVDVALVVTGLDGDFNPRRIERYVATAWDGGATPVVVLNKADLAADLDGARLTAEAVAPGVAVLAVSALGHEGLDALVALLPPGATAALLGSSGAGKSTLANALLGAARQVTQDVRAADSRGRHTTTARELFALPCGAVLIDTPGMRELQLWTDGDGVEDAFADVAVLAAGCRFADCAHDTEPGCAVRAAVAAGALPQERLASWQKLRRELRWLATRRDARARAEEESRWKAIHKSMRHHPKSDRWRQ